MTSAYDYSEGDAGNAQIKQLADGQWYRYDPATQQWRYIEGQPHAQAKTQGAPDATYDAQGQAWVWNGRDWARDPRFDNPTKAAGYRAPSTAQPAAPESYTDRNGDIVGIDRMTGREVYRIAGADWPKIDPAQQRAIQQGDLQAAREWDAGQSALERAARSAESEANRTASSQEAAAGRAFQGGESALDRAQRAGEFAANYGLSARQTAMQEQQAKIATARTLSDVISNVDPAAVAAFQAAGGGVLANSIAGGNTAVSDAAVLPAARIFREIDRQDQEKAAAEAAQQAQANARQQQIRENWVAYNNGAQMRANPFDVRPVADPGAARLAADQARASSMAASINRAAPPPAVNIPSPTRQVVGEAGSGASWDPMGTGGIQRFAFGTHGPDTPDPHWRPSWPDEDDPNWRNPFTNQYVDVLGVDDRRGETMKPRGRYGPPVRTGGHAPRYAFGTQGEPASGPFVAGDSTDPFNPAAGGARPELVIPHDPPGPNNATADVQPLMPPSAPAGGGSKLAELFTVIGSLLGSEESAEPERMAYGTEPPRYAFGTGTVDDPTGQLSLVAPEDAPFIAKARAIREGVDTKPPIEGGYFNVGFGNLAGTAQQRYYAALQSRYGASAQDFAQEADRFRTPGVGQSVFRLGY